MRTKILLFLMHFSLQNFSQTSTELQTDTVCAGLAYTYEIVRPDSVARVEDETGVTYSWGLIKKEGELTESGKNKTKADVKWNNKEGDDIVWSVKKRRQCIGDTIKRKVVRIKPPTATLDTSHICNGEILINYDGKTPATLTYKMNDQDTSSVNITQKPHVVGKPSNVTIDYTFLKVVDPYGCEYSFEKGKRNVQVFPPLSKLGEISKGKQKK